MAGCNVLAALKTTEPVRVNLSQVNRHKVYFVLALRAVLHEMCKANRTPETLRAAQEVEDKMVSALGTSL